MRRGSGGRLGRQAVGDMATRGAGEERLGWARSPLPSSSGSGLEAGNMGGRAHVSARVRGAWRVRGTWGAMGEWTTVNFNI